MRYFILGATTFFVLITLLVLLFMVADTISEISKPTSTITTIEYLEITHPDTGLHIEVRGLKSEFDNRILILLAAMAD